MEIERRLGKPIQTGIFAEQGEPAFREAEAQAIAELCRRDRVVLAVGGALATMRADTRGWRADFRLPLGWRSALALRLGSPSTRL